MAELPGNPPTDLRRVARQYIDSLRAAGVEWVPVASQAAPEPMATQGANEATASQPPTPMLQGSLVADGAGAAEEGNVAQVRRQELEVLATRVAGCTRCSELVASRSQTVFGVGKLSPELCFVGEAPGADEDRQGEPFVGQAGQLLNRIIAACGFKREEVYICNIIKCRPPGNRVPQAHEAGNCREYLERQIALVAPRFLCALGATAAQNLLGTKTGIGKLRGRFFDFKGIPVICTFHPAALLPGRSPEKKKDVWEDMKMLLARMGRPVPGK